MLYLIEILHQTTTLIGEHTTAPCCILLKFYIKPQLKANKLSTDVVLYLIEILHQTTTKGTGLSASKALYLIEILHQTTTPYFEQ